MVSEQRKFTYAAALSRAGEVNEATPTSESPVHPNLTVPQRNLSPQVQRNYVEEVDNPLIINRNNGKKGGVILVNPQRMIPIHPQRMIPIHPQRKRSKKTGARSSVRSASSMIPQRNLSSEQQMPVADPQRKAIFSVERFSLSGKARKPNSEIDGWRIHSSTSASMYDLQRRRMEEYLRRCERMGETAAEMMDQFSGGDGALKTTMAVEAVMSFHSSRREKSVGSREEEEEDGEVDVNFSGNSMSPAVSATSVRAPSTSKSSGAARRKSREVANDIWRSLDLQEEDFVTDNSDYYFHCSFSIELLFSLCPNRALVQNRARYKQEELLTAIFALLKTIYGLGVSDHLPWLGIFDLQGSKSTINKAMIVMRKHLDTEVDVGGC